MHELQVTERILEIALQHAAGHAVDRIVTIHLRVGELSDLEESWLQHYFDYLSRGTLAENARLAIARSPIVVECQACTQRFEVTREALRDPECPECRESRCRLISGREYFVETMEVL